MAKLRVLNLGNEYFPPPSVHPQDRSRKTAFCLRCRWLSPLNDPLVPSSSHSFKEQNQSFISSLPISVAASVRLVWTRDLGVWREDGACYVKKPLMKCPTRYLHALLADFPSESDLT